MRFVRYKTCQTCFRAAKSRILLGNAHRKQVVNVDLIDMILFL